MIDVDLARSRMMILRISAEKLSALVNVAPNRLGQWLNGVRALSTPEALRVRQTLIDLEALSKYAAPFEPSWRDVGLTRKLLESMQAGRLKDQILENLQTL